MKFFVEELEDSHALVFCCWESVTVQIYDEELADDVIGESDTIEISDCGKWKVLVDTYGDCFGVISYKQEK